MSSSPKQRFEDMPAAQQAGILCNDPRFQDYAAMRCGMPKGTFGASAAAEYLRQVCQISSRRDLGTSAEAAARFQALRTTFDAHTGKQATPSR